jgi:hypothetical protein
VTAAADPGTADALRGLDARSWAQLLRALRVVPNLPDSLAAHLDRPISELASGAARGALCGELAGTETALAALRADASLPAAVHAAIGSATGGRSEVPDAPPEEDASPGGSDDGPERFARRDRALRRTLEDERRRREGAEAWAVAADVRAADADAARDALEARLAAMERELADAADAVRQAVERAERRAESRTAALEDELASERSAHAVLRREHERMRMELAAVNVAIGRLQEQVDRAPGPVADASHGRPLELPSELGPDTTEAASWLARRVSLLLVDGYNVSLALRGGHPLEEQRRWLIERIRPMVVRGSATPVLVFDGDGQASSRRDRSGVEVRFTAAGTTADDEIGFAVAATADPVLVITDDAELRERVRAEGGNVIGTVHLLGAIDA